MCVQAGVHYLAGLLQTLTTFRYTGSQCSCPNMCSLRRKSACAPISPCSQGTALDCYAAHTGLAGRSQAISRLADAAKRGLRALSLHSHRANICWIDDQGRAAPSRWTPAPTMKGSQSREPARR